MLSASVVIGALRVKARNLITLEQNVSLLDGLVVLESAHRCVTTDQKWPVLLVTFPLPLIFGVVRRCHGAG